MSRQQGVGAGSPFVAEVAWAAAVGLVVAAIGTLVIGLLFTKAPVVVASVFCAVFAKVALEYGRRATEELAAQGRRSPDPFLAETSLASRPMSTRPSGRGDPGDSEDASRWSLDDLFADDDDPVLGPGTTRRAAVQPPSRTSPPERGSESGRPASGPPPSSSGSSSSGSSFSQRFAAPPSPSRSSATAASSAAASPTASARRPAGDVGGQIDQSLDRFGEHLVGSLNQLFDEYVGEALSKMQASLTAERQDLAELRNQLKAIVKAGARREEALRDELSVSRDAVDELRDELSALRDDVAALGSPESPAHDEIAQLAQEVRALRKRLPFQKRPGGGGGLEPQQVQAVADAVAAAILKVAVIEQG